MDREGRSEAASAAAGAAGRKFENKENKKENWVRFLKGKNGEIFKPKPKKKKKIEHEKGSNTEFLCENILP